jgi:proline racemase
MDAEGFPPMSGHAIVAVATIALERGLIVPGGDGRAVTFDTPAGTVRAVADLRDQRVACVTFTTQPSFFVRPGLEIALGSRRIRADIAFGGLLYAIVDGESVGVPLDGAHLPELRRAGADIVRAVNSTTTISHPHDGELTGVHGTIFTGPSRDGAADLRNVTVSASSAVDRSACGTATAAVMAVIDAMGLLDDTRPFVHESILGTTLRGRVAGRTIVGDVPAILPEIEGAASITGDHTFRLDEDDPIGGGFQLS